MFNFIYGINLPTHEEVSVHFPGCAVMVQPFDLLHPRVQVARMRELLANLPSEGVALTTHSETIACLVQHMVGEGELNHQCITFWWFKEGEWTDLLLNQAGGFGHPWPEGFFLERLKIARGEL